MSVANQKIIYGSVLAPCDKENLYMVINQDALFAAMEDLKPVGFKMWLYFSKNQASHKFDLSLEACKKLGIKKNTYYEGLKELETKGYLVPASGNGFFFYQIPKIGKPSEIRNDMLTNDGVNFSENQTQFSEIQTEPSEFRNKSSEIPQRNNTNNTDSTKDNTNLAAAPQKITLKEAKALEAAQTVNCRIDWANGVLRFSNGATYQLEG